jgi:hypothetical protein
MPTREMAEVRGTIKAVEVSVESCVGGLSAAWISIILGLVGKEPCL